MFKEKLALLPDKPGCYIYKDKDGLIIYVGKAKNLKKRVNSYFNKIQTGKTFSLVSNISSFEYIVTNSEVESLILELNLIKKYNPKYNIMLKDDKTYPYIELTKDKYPTLRIIRSKNRKKVKGKLFGPYPNVLSARKIVELINRIYPFRKCNRLPKEVCLYYHINECLGYCQYDIDEQVINDMKNEIINFLNGDYKIVTKKLEEEMYKASESLNFEKAKELKLMIDEIKYTLNKQVIVSNIKYNFDVFGIYQDDNFLTIETLFIRDGVIVGKAHKIFSDYFDIGDVYTRYIIDFYDKYSLPKEVVINDITSSEVLSEYLDVPVLVPKKGDIKKILKMANLNAEVTSKEKTELIKRNNDLKISSINSLKELLGMNKLSRIELFDNSHLFGTYYVGAMVSYLDFVPDRNLYRKYKISIDTKDDLSAMREVIYRRYYRVLLDKLVIPDLIIVDGGELQVRVAKEVIDSLNLDIRVIGLKKDNKHRTSIIVDSNLREIDIKDNNLMIYLAKMQEEVHRFVITYHRDIKSKGAISSILEQVDGIGDKRRKELLKKYGSIKKMKEASVEDLSKIIPEKVASELKEYLKKLG